MVSSNIPYGLRWIEYFSYMRYAFIGFMVNDLKGYKVFVTRRGKTFEILDGRLEVCLCLLRICFVVTAKALKKC